MAAAISVTRSRKGKIENSGFAERVVAGEVRESGGEIRVKSINH